MAAHQRKGCCPEARGGPLWSLAALGGSCGVQETRTLGNAAGSLIRCEPRDLRETWFHRWVQALSAVRSCLWHHRLHFPCFLFSSISILFSRRFSSLSFFCLTRFRFSSSSSDKPAVRCFNLHVNIHAATRSTARTCEGLQRFLGQDWWLEH